MDGLQCVSVELQSAPIRSVELIRATVSADTRRWLSLGQMGVYIKHYCFAKTQQPNDCHRVGHGKHHCSHVVFL